VQRDKHFYIFKNRLKKTHYGWRIPSQKKTACMMIVSFDDCIDKDIKPSGCPFYGIILCDKNKRISNVFLSKRHKVLNSDFFH